MTVARHKTLRVLLCLTAMLPLGTFAQVVITTQPQSQSVQTGTRLTLTVQATGNGPLSYQWRLNGVNIPGANSSTFTITSFQTPNAGDYTVAVGDNTDAVNSDVAQIRVANLNVLPFTDAMNDQNRITGSNGTGRGANVGATKEPGEPDHAGKPGTNSVWLTWQAPLLGGVVTLDTAGSSFDTLLAVYTGDSVTGLTLVASNDDVNECDDPARAFHTSRLKFNAKAGTVYHIAVDGLSGASGDIVLSWKLNALEGLLSVLNIVPTVTVGLPGDSLSLSVSVQNANSVTYQWYLNCVPLPGATENILRLDNLQRPNVGDYIVHVKDALGVETVSDPANVQINITDGRALDVVALDKFPESAARLRSSLAAAPRLQRAALRSSSVRKQSGGPARGYRGSQIFSTVGATKDPGEPNHCGEPGGASEWYAYQPPATGLLLLDTEGSDFDTVLAVYTGPGTDFESLVSVACDNNSGSDGKTSKTGFQVTKDTVYYIAVDGVGGASGTVELNYNLGVEPIIVQQPLTQTVPAGGEVTLSVTASGTPTPGYQWRFGPTGMICETNTSLTITNFQAANEGDYSVVASNFAGASVSIPATLLLDSPLRLASFSFSNNTAYMRLIGQTNGSYAIQSSSNLVDWTSLATNSLPYGIWDFVETNLAADPYCFYRAVSQ